jgi:MYXO-CTERM domain-containing protein
VTINSRARRLLLALLNLVILLLVAGPALAAGRVEWKEKKVKEREDKSWRLEMAIYLPKAPDVAHVPMKFEFQPEIYYERYIEEGEKVIERKVPLVNRQALIESVDVGFLDSGSGKIETRTRFSFKVTRAHGYEAGEYKVTIKDTRNGQTVGTPTTLIFEGENELIDRRPMVFTGKKKEKKDEAKAGEGEKPKEGGAAEGDAPERGSSESDSAPVQDDAALAEDEPAPDGEIKEKPGGCGCRIEDAPQTGSSALFAALALAAALVLRRRR